MKPLIADRYLWVFFQIESICSQKTDKDILIALKDLPKDLPETYDRILQKLQQSQFADLAFARKVYGLLVAARRPLTLDALREAVSVELGVTVWDPRKMVNNMLISLNCCGSLVIVDEEDSTVQLAHHSVKQYLLSESTRQSISQYHVELAEADLLLGDICVTYLNMGIFDKRLTRSTPSPKLQVSSTVLDGTLPQSNPVNKLALKYLKSRRDKNCDVRLRLEDIARLSVQPGRTGPAVEEFHFLAYARDYWLFHTKAYRSTRTRGVYTLWCNLVDGRVNIVDLPWAPENSSEVGDELVNWITQENHEALACRAFDCLCTVKAGDDRDNKVMRLISVTPVDFQMNKSLLNKVLSSAIIKHDRRLMLLILERRVDMITGSNVKYENGGYGTALQVAAASGDESIVRLLLEYGADVNAQGGHYGNVLQAAVRENNDSMVRLLLDKDAERQRSRWRIW